MRGERQQKGGHLPIWLDSACSKDAFPVSLNNLGKSGINGVRFNVLTCRVSHAVIPFFLGWPCRQGQGGKSQDPSSERRKGEETRFCRPDLCRRRRKKGEEGGIMSQKAKRGSWSKEGGARVSFRKLKREKRAASTKAPPPPPPQSLEGGRAANDRS